MASLNCDLIFSYNNKRDYIGIMNFRNIISMQVQHVFDATSSTPDAPQGMVPMYTGAYTGVTVNGIDFGTGRIISFANPVSVDITEDGRHLWKQVLNVEVYESGDLSNISAVDPAVSGLLNAYSTNLQAFSETLSFDITPEGDYRFNHNCSIRCNQDPISLISGYIQAKNIAAAILADRPPFGYIDSVHSGFYATGVGKRLYTETIDVQNGTATFQETLDIQSRDFVKHSVGFENGYCNVTESATLRHSGFSTASDVFASNAYLMNTRFNNALGGAYTRCNSLYGTYATVLGTDAYANSLNLQPVQIQKVFDERTQELNYAVTYSCNPMMTNSGYTIDRELAFSRNVNGVAECAENGTLITYGFKDASLMSFLTTAILAEKTGARDRLDEIWPNVSSFKLSSDNSNISSRGKRGGYSLSYTNDPSLVYDGVFISMITGVQDMEPIRIHNPYLIVGQGSPLVHDPGQTQIGVVTSTVSAVLVRPDGYSPDSPNRPDTALNQMFVTAINNALQVTSSKAAILDTFLTKVDYSYTAAYTAEMSVELQFTYARTTRI